jgi:hypothetical protein
VSSNAVDLSRLERIEALFQRPILYELGDQIPTKGLVGRPRDYPPYLWIAYLALKNECDSARRVEAEFADRRIWRLIRRTVKRMFPDDPARWPPRRPMRRHHFLYARRYLDDDDIFGQLHQAFRELEAASAVQDLRALDPSGPGSYTHPHPDRLIHADGKVVTPLFRAKQGSTRVDKATGEVLPVRHDPDARLHVEGDGKEAWGNKFVLAATRTDEGRFILDWEYVPGKGGGGEAGVAMEIFERLIPHLPGTQGVAYDMALRGKHLDRLMRRLGVLGIARVPAKANRSRRRGQRSAPWIDKDTLIEVQSLTLPDGTALKVPLYARGGALGIPKTTDTGEEVFIPLRRLRTQRFAAKGGSYRLYNQYQLPPELGGGEITVRLYGNEEDERRGLNRAENLRAIPPSDPDFDRLYARRNDSESLNRALEDALYLGRAQSVGWVRQRTDLLGFALMQNTITWARLRKRKRRSAAA